MLRRSVIVTMGVAACGSILHAHAQPARTPHRIAVLHAGTHVTSGHMQDSFRAGLQELGWREGQDVVMEVRFADGDIVRMDSLMSELMAWHPDLIYAPTTSAAQAAQRATRSIPIVFSTVADPVGAGLVTTLSHPGGNATGLGTISIELTAKRFEFLREAVPGLSRLAVLNDPTYGFGAQSVRQLRRLATESKIEITLSEASNETALIQFLERLSQRSTDGLFVVDNPLHYRYRQMITARANRARVPAVYPVSEYVLEGGLMSYGPNFAEQSRRAAAVADKIMRGMKPADIPVVQPSEFELILNVNAARAIGMTLPRSLLLRAYRVIE